MHGHFVKGRTTSTNGTPNEALSNLLSLGSEGSASFSKLNFFAVFRPFKLPRLPTANFWPLSRAAGKYFSEMRSSSTTTVAEWSGVTAGGG